MLGSLHDAIMDVFFPETKDSPVKDSAHTPGATVPIAKDGMFSATLTIPPSTHCCMCGGKIEVMSFKGTKVCSTKCDKAARGETPDGWIETRAGRVSFYLGKRVRFDLIDPYLHVEGTLAEVKDSDLSKVYVKVILKDPRGTTAGMKAMGRVASAVAGNVPTSWNLTLDHRIDFKP